MNLLRGAAWAGGGATALQLLPAVTTWPALRRRVSAELSGVGHEGHLALTFDDGPDPASTPQFLAYLEREGVQATFFLLGSMLAKAPNLGRELVDAGHEVALHGWSHRPLPLRGPASTLDDLTRGRDLVGEVTGRRPDLYRPPYGVLTASALLATRRLGLRPVLWTAWGRDWERRATPSSVVRTVQRTAGGGGTVLLHDSDCTSAPGSWRTTLAALPPLLDAWRAQGLTVGPLRGH